MGINRVQFQKGLSLPEFMERYGTEAQCHAAVVAQRWPNGFVCPACGGTRHCAFERKGLSYWQCSACREQTSILCGTIFESTKLPLSTWFLGMYLLTQAKNNVSALELKRHLGVRYKTAWLLKHKLMQVMSEREASRQLDGRVEIDDPKPDEPEPNKQKTPSAMRRNFGRSADLRPCICSRKIQDMCCNPLG